MKREDVIREINFEREYQDHLSKKGGTHIVEDFKLGSALSAIQHKLEIARDNWYSGTDPHTEAMHELRKIAAICVQMGEQYGMRSRDYLM